MTDDPSRTTQYESIRKRFLSDPEFRDQLTQSPAQTLESILGPLNDQERAWLAAAPDSADELVDHVTQNAPPLGYW